MLNNTFQGTLTKHQHVYKEDEVFVKFSLKHTSLGEVQVFLDSLSKVLNQDNYKTLFVTPIQWKKLVFDFSDSTLINEMNIEFDEIEFDARLQEVSVTRKYKNGTDTFEYVMSFIKDVGAENEDSILAKTYLNRKEEDDDGKKTTVMYDVNIQRIEQ